MDVALGAVTLHTRRTQVVSLTSGPLSCRRKDPLYPSNISLAVPRGSSLCLGDAINLSLSQEPRHDFSVFQPVT